ncbi:MAG: mRNA surveillance protein pelota [Candidatus Lokiarchaeota archaeon]|nr:mRNA surveillance protein pelota [Candidatus Lokiarchaeota archaeon]
MKILEENLKQGEITVNVENLNDLWTLYNIISKGDYIRALTQRRVIINEGTSGERRLMDLTLDVEDISFHEFSNRLRIKGRIIQGPDDFVSFGSYHTFNIEINQKLMIKKEKWMKQDLKRIKEISKLSSTFNLFIIAVESGLSNIFLITNYSRNKIATINKNIPGKRYEQSMRNKYINEFFEEIKTIIETNVSNENIDLIIVCGPGSIKDHLIKFLKEKSKMNYSSKLRSLLASSGTESAIYEILKSNELIKLKDKIKALEEIERIEEIMTLLSKDPDLIAIGFDEITKALNMGAVKQLLISDTQIRGSSKTKKIRIEEMIDSLEKIGGEFKILNTNHPAGEQLEGLGSIVAILRYKI